MKTGIMTKQFTKAFVVGSAAVMVMLLSAGSVQATDQSWTSGTTTLTNSSGVDTDNDIVDNATLIVTNGGSLLASQLTVSTGNVSTLTLTGSGAITVKQLWVTNNTAAVTNSVFNFNGGTLITSNAVGSVAARIVRPLPFSIGSNWTMNGGTNTIGAAGTVPTGSHVTIGNNATVTVNSGAIYNNGGLTIAFGANTTLNINGGVMTNINCTSTAGFNVTGGNSSMTVTNNGKLFTSGGSTRTAIIGQISDSNRGFIGSGGLWNFGGIGLQLGVSSTAAKYNTLTVDAGGIVTNMGACSVGIASTGGSGALGNQVVITNGGCVFGNSYVTVGSTSGSNPATSNRVTVVGSTSLLNIGDGISVGYSTGTGKISYNSLLITNGASVVSKGACTIGNGTNANSNYVIVAGASGGNNAMWNLSGSNLTIGGNAVATGNWAVVSTGGMITNGAIVLGGVNSTLYFNGGTLAAGTNDNLISTNSTAVNASCYIQSAGAVIDSGAYSVTNTVPLVQDPSSTGGGLTKLGSGRLVLAGTSRYTGATAVSNGTLTLAADGVITNSPLITVASGAVYGVSSVSGYEVVAGQTLAGKGVVTGSVTVVAGGILAAGGTNATGTLSFSNTLTLAASAVIDWNYDDTTNDVIKVATLGTLPNVATVTVSKVTGTTRAQPLPAVLCTFAQGGPGGDTDLSGWVVTGGSAGTRVVVRGNQIQLRAFTGTLLQLY
jgi:hypothetical protein